MIVLALKIANPDPWVQWKFCLSWDCRSQLAHSSVHVQITATFLKFKQNRSFSFYFFPQAKSFRCPAATAAALQYPLSTQLCRMHWQRQNNTQGVCSTTNIYGSIIPIITVVAPRDLKQFGPPCTRCCTNILEKTFSAPDSLHEKGQDLRSGKDKLFLLLFLHIFYKRIGMFLLCR